MLVFTLLTFISIDQIKKDLALYLEVAIKITFLYLARVAIAMISRINYHCTKNVARKLAIEKIAKHAKST